MKNFLITLGAICFANLATAGAQDGKISFTQRQQRAVMEVTSVHLIRGGGIITARGSNGRIRTRLYDI